MATTHSGKKHSTKTILIGIHTFAAGEILYFYHIERAKRKKRRKESRRCTYNCSTKSNRLTIGSVGKERSKAEQQSGTAPSNSLNTSRNLQHIKKMPENWRKTESIFISSSPFYPISISLNPTPPLALLPAMRNPLNFIFNEKERKKPPNFLDHMDTYGRVPSVAAVLSKYSKTFFALFSSCVFLSSSCFLFRNHKLFAPLHSGQRAEGARTRDGKSEK